MKQSWKPGTVLYPLPAVLVSCGAAPEEYNMLTVAWTGTVCSDPPMCFISVRPERHSHALIARTGEFTINLTTAAMARAVDWCGVRSGRDYDKFRETGLTPLRGAVVAAPALEESPVVVECRVRQILPLGSHDMFLAEVVNVLVDDRYIDSATGRFDLERAGLVAYSHGEYFRLGELIGHFGWSVRKKPRRTVGAAPAVPAPAAGNIPAAEVSEAPGADPGDGKPAAKRVPARKPVAPAARRSRRKPDAKKPRR